MIRNLYSRDGYSILTACRNCGRVGYCEQHGTTAPCKCTNELTERAEIPQRYLCGMACIYYRGPARIPLTHLD